MTLGDHKLLSEGRPRISHEQYWEPILRWFGCNNADIAATLLRRHLFAGASPNLLALAA